MMNHGSTFMVPKQCDNHQNGNPFRYRDQIDHAQRAAKRNFAPCFLPL
jgi:hypothetical protein